MLIIAYIFSTWKQSRLHLESVFVQQALIWLLFAPFGFVHGTLNLGINGSWRQVIISLSYFLYISVVPFLFVGMFIVISYFK